MIYGITLILLSIIAVPSLLLSKKPNAKELLEKVAPYQSWIGVVFCFFGIWGIITAFLNFDMAITSTIWWITLVLGSLVQAILGFILGYGLLMEKVFAKSEEAKNKAIEIREKLAPKQGKLGMLGLAVGTWMIVASFIFGI